MIRCFLILFLFGQTVFAQQNLTLSKRQMHADFDTLVATIKKVSPHISIKKDLWKYDALKEMYAQKKCIDTIKNDFSFYILLKRILHLSQDMHTSTWGKQIGWAELQEKKYKKVSDAFKLSIPNIYINGEYIITDPFLIDLDTIEVGTKIVKINNISIDNYLKKKISGEYYQYDSKRKKMYYSGFFRNIETLFIDSINITFKTEKGEVKTYRFSTKKFTRYLPDIGVKNSDSTRIDYWANEKILYIRLTEMNPSYVSTLKEKLVTFRNKLNEIDKIIIDFRNNGGGQDRAWQNLYAEIIDKTISYPLVIDDYKNSVLTKEKIEKFGIKVNEPIKVDDNPLLRKYDFYRIANTIESIEPSATSMRYNGKIYVLAENHYSSTGSAISVANSNPNDNLISVGRKTGYFLGIGFSPQQFLLPNTQLRYRIAPSIEVTNVKTLLDLMHDKTEIEVPYSIEELKNKYNYKGDISKKEYLLEFDSFIKFVMNQ